MLLATTAAITLNKTSLLKQQQNIAWTQAPQDGQDDDDEEEEEEERSEQPFTDPTSPGLYHLVADTIPSLIGDRVSQPVSKQYDILLDIFDPACAACAMWKPVIQQLAYAFEYTPQVKIMMYDDSENYRRGFIREKDRKALPVIMFLPFNDTTMKAHVSQYDSQSSPSIQPVLGQPTLSIAPSNYSTVQTSHSPQARPSPMFPSVMYVGPPNARTLLTFLYTHRSVDWDYAAVEKRLNEKNAETDKEIRRLADLRFKKDPLFHLYSNAPCGYEQFRWMNEEMSSRFISHPKQETLTKLFEKFQKCAKGQVEQQRDYWELVQYTAQQNLNALDGKGFDEDEEDDLDAKKKQKK